MPFDVTPLLPAVITFAAALVAGGIARSNLIATKETKISEFRQAWIDALRKDLATLFSSTRTLARATQEARATQASGSTKFHFEQGKITEVRYGAAETYYRIKLRLNRNQPDHKVLLLLLSEMISFNKSYSNNIHADVQLPLNQVEKASDQAEVALKSEWNAVKGGEEAYRSAVKITTWVLIVSGVLWSVIVVGAPVNIFFSEAGPKTGSATSIALSQL